MGSQGMYKIFGLIVSLVVLTACSTVAVEPGKDGRYADIKLFSPIPDKAVVYVYREDAIADGYYPTRLIVNGHTVSTSARNSYNILVLPPGEYDIGVTSSFQEGDYLPMDVNFNAGEVHYLNVYWEKTAHWEKDEGFRLKAVTENRARKHISSARLIAFKELCPDYQIDPEEKNKLGNSQVFFRSYRAGICNAPPP